MSQYDGKKSGGLVKVPLAVRKAAQYAFVLKDIGFKGATETGWKRAKQLSTKDEISLKDVRYMRNWYARHVYTSRPGYDSWVQAGRPKTSDWFNKRSIIAWYTWGGDAGLNWINSKRIMTRLENEYDKVYGHV
jgi:hypothetical protein